MPKAIFSSTCAALALASALLAAAPVSASAANQGEIEEGPSAAAAGDAGPATRESYPASYFERFAPRNALDMLQRVPGFDVQTARENNRHSSQSQRGLGQASENVLINRERLTSKSDSISDELARIPASNVVRIEVLDGTTLDIPGLSGQVANIVVNSSGGISGRFSYSPAYRPEPDQFLYTRGNASITRSRGPLDITLAVDSRAERYGARGPTFITDADGNLIESRQSLYLFDNDRVSFSSILRYTPVSGLIANLNLSYTPTGFDTAERETRIIVDGTDSSRRRAFESEGHEYELSGDIEFDLGPGRLKLIGVESYKTSDRADTAIFTYEDGSPQTGTRFALDSDSGERIARGEYAWPMLGLDWQISGEAAFNRLDNVGALLVLNSLGDFVAIPFPGGTGGVREDRYETILSAGGALNDTLSFQLAGGAEFSTISQTGASDTERSFTRPKGSLALAWSPPGGWNLAFEAARRVGQLDFGDFLASVSFSDDTANSANAELVPQQSWEFELEVTRQLGRLGTANLTVFHHRIEDLVDFIPLADGTAAKGNIARATRSGVSADITFELGQLGWQGARLDLEGSLERSRLTDPVDGSRRPISSSTPHSLDIDLRHDIPRTDLAWGAGFRSTRYGRYFRVGELGRTYSGPDYWTLFAEHKDVLGLTVKAEVDGIFGPQRRLVRTIYDGLRGSAPVEFLENRDQRLGPLYTLTISGNF